MILFSAWYSFLIIIFQILTIIGSPKLVPKVRIGSTLLLVPQLYFFINYLFVGV